MLPIGSPRKAESTCTVSASVRVYVSARSSCGNQEQAARAVIYGVTTRTNHRSAQNKDREILQDQKQGGKSETEG